MTSAGKRFTVLQRFLHWLMAICILAMLFIGVGMNSTVVPKYVPLLATHRTLGAIILVLALIRLAVRLRRGFKGLAKDGNRSNRRTTKSAPCNGSQIPQRCLDVVRGTHLGQRSWRRASRPNT
jgi:cytochrome b561